MSEPPSTAPQTAPCNHPEIHTNHAPGTSYACALTEVERWTDLAMRSKVALDDVWSLREGKFTDMKDANLEVQHAKEEVIAARRVLELAEARLRRAQTKGEQMAKRYDVAERAVAPAQEEYFGASQMMIDAKANALLLECPGEMHSTYVRRVSGEVGELAIPSLIAAGPFRTEKRRQRHQPYPARKDLPPKAEPLPEEHGRQPRNLLDVEISKLDEDTVIDVGCIRYLIRRDPEDVWAGFISRSRDGQQVWNEAHKNDILNLLGYGPRQAVKPSEFIDTKWGIMQVMSREEAEVMAGCQWAAQLRTF